MKPLFLLDTNTVSYYLRNNPTIVRQYIANITLQQTSISVITQSELLYGVALHPNSRSIHNAIHTFLANTTIYAWTPQVAELHAKLRAQQKIKGRPIATEDLMIAAHALALNLTLVTSDKVFSHIEGLRTIDWSI